MQRQGPGPLQALRAPCPPAAAALRSPAAPLSHKLAHTRAAYSHDYGNHQAHTPGTGPPHSASWQLAHGAQVLPILLSLHQESADPLAAPLPNHPDHLHPAAMTPSFCMNLQEAKPGPSFAAFVAALASHLYFFCIADLRAPTVRTEHSANNLCGARRQRCVQSLAPTMRTEPGANMAHRAWRKQCVRNQVQVMHTEPGAFKKAPHKLTASRIKILGLLFNPAQAKPLVEWTEHTHSICTSKSADMMTVAETCAPPRAMQAAVLLSAHFGMRHGLAWKPTAVCSSHSHIQGLCQDCEECDRDGGVAEAQLCIPDGQEHACSSSSNTACVCVCVPVCARVCVCACVHACMCVYAYWGAGCGWLRMGGWLGGCTCTELTLPCKGVLPVSGFKLCQLMRASISGEVWHCLLFVGI
eukprot:scaffold83445_cov21-Tisochrysis_lutea.AAC.1